MDRLLLGNSEKKKSRFILGSQMRTTWKCFPEHLWLFYAKNNNFRFLFIYLFFGEMGGGIWDLHFRTRRIISVQLWFWSFSLDQHPDWRPEEQEVWWSGGLTCCTSQQQLEQQQHTPTTALTTTIGTTTLLSSYLQCAEQ